MKLHLQVRYETKRRSAPVYVRLERKTIVAPVYELPGATAGLQPESRHGGHDLERPDMAQRCKP